MKHMLRSTAAFLCLLLSFSPFNQAAFSQTAASSSSSQPAPGLNAPVPAEIRTAHTVFLSNMGADANFPVDATTVYNDIYAALQSWGHYQLVSSPEQADLLFQLRGVSSLTTYSDANGNIFTNNNPAFQLTMVDPRSGVTLWTINSPVALAGSKQTRARWLSIAETNLVSRIKVVAGEPLAPSESAALTTVPPTHHTRTALLITGGAIAFGVGGALLLHHLYENSLANQKASQDAFCNANNIPLSECAGG